MVKKGQVYQGIVSRGNPQQVDRITVKRVYRSVCRVLSEVTQCERFPRLVGKKRIKTMDVSMLESKFYAIVPSKPVDSFGYSLPDPQPYIETVPGL